MENSRPRHRLHIESTQPGAVFRVTDGRSAKVGSGMYRLDLELPQGLYSVSAMMGASTESKTVLLDRDSQVTLTPVQPSFGDMAFAIMEQIREETATRQFFYVGGTTIVTVRGPFATTPSPRHKVQVKAGRVTVKAVVDGMFKEDAGHFWHWQLFRVSKPGSITVMREVNGEVFSHTVPCFGAWTVWAAYPAPPEVAHPEVTLPNPFYARMRLTQSGNAPDLSLQSLSDQVFTALASRTALPLSKLVLDLLFGDGADPLLALAAAHLISLKLCHYGRLNWFPQDKVRSVPPSGEDANEGRLAEEPVSLDEIHEYVRKWLMAPRTEEIADCPDMIAVRYLYGINTDFADDFELEKPPVLLRSLDALLDLEHTASERRRKFVLRDSVWSTQFQVSDAFALLQWHTDAKKGKKKRLALINRSFVMSKEFEYTLQELHSADVAETSTPASAFEATGAGKDMGLRLVTIAYRELKSYLEMNAQALRLPSTAIEVLTKEITRQNRRGTPRTGLIVHTRRDIARVKKNLKDLMA